MNENIKLEAQLYIKNNCKLYKDYFYLKNINTLINRVVKILEKKLLNVNTFCYYVSNALDELYYNSSYYCELSKSDRKRLNFYSNAFVKISMHLDLIFNEIDGIKKCFEKSKFHM